MITVACVLVRGYVNYTTEYVSRLRSMVRRHLPQPHTFVCLTDQKEVDADVRWIIPTPENMYPWWAKIQLFNPRLFEANQKILYLDLDTLPVADLTPIVNAPSFTLIPHAGRFKGKDGLKTVPRFNSSCMVWHAQEGYHLFNAWSHDVPKRLWGDQDWIGEKMPGAQMFPLEWFPRLSEFNAPKGIIPDEAKVILCKKPKNEIAARQWPWFKERWQ